MLGMKQIYMQVSGTTSSKKYHVPFIDEGRLVGARVCNSTAQGDAAANVTFGKNGATHSIFTANLQNAAARTTTKGEFTTDVTDAEKNQIFDCDTPLEIDVNLQANSELTILLIFDPFVIGSRNS